MTTQLEQLLSVAEREGWEVIHIVGTRSTYFKTGDHRVRVRWSPGLRVSEAQIDRIGPDRTIFCIESMGPRASRKLQVVTEWLTTYTKEPE